MKELINILKMYRIPVSTEGLAQKSIQDILEAHGINFTREFKLTQKSRVDFLLHDGTAIEVKVDGWSPMKIYRQLERYAEHPLVKRLFLVTAQAIQLPNQIKGKEAAVFRLGQGWL